jgi:ribonuclease D
MHPSLVRSDAQLTEIAQRLEKATELAIDSEFHGEGRYYPQLCLVQLAFGDELWAIEVRSVNLRLLGPALASSAITKLLHDGRQDIPILQRATGASITNVFDTQVAAGFAGYGGSIGYAALVRALADAEIDKSLQGSDWSGTLSDAQLEYALDDVRYLGGVAGKLRAALESKGRLSWALEACEEARERASTRHAPETLYRRVGSTSKLAEGPLGVLRELAIWRDRVAEATDKPLVTVANDLALKSMAMQPPKDARALGSVRGLGVGRAQPWASELLEAVARGRARPEPKAAPSVHDAGLLDGVAGLLSVARRDAAARADLAPELLADQTELRELVEWHLDGRSESVKHAVLEGWRHEVLGALLLRVLAGEVRLSVDAASATGITIA